MTTAAIPSVHASAGAASVSLPRIAGFAGLSAVVIGTAQAVVVGEIPGLGASTTEVVDFFAGDSSALKIGVVVPALLAIPIALFFIGVYRTLAIGDRENDSYWAPLFLMGSVMMSASAGISEGLFAMLALRGGEGLSPETIRLVNDGSQIASATIGVWAAVALGAVVAATFLNKVRPAWYGWFTAAAAVLGVLGVIDTVSTSSGGIFALLAFFGGFILFTIVTSVLMIREN